MTLSYISEVDKRWPCKATQGEGQTHTAKTKAKTFKAKVKIFVLKAKA